MASVGRGANLRTSSKLLGTTQRDAKRFSSSDNLFENSCDFLGSICTGVAERPNIRGRNRKSAK